MNYLYNYKECLKAIEESKNIALKQIEELENKHVRIVIDNCFKTPDSFNSIKIKNL